MPTNRLAQATSPYLLQHAHNPVDWYPWGEEALARARQEDKPIFLSVGYASCHWCHVMAHESFEDAVTAELMNALFVNVKVDREERPDLDEIYMQAVQLFTGGHGGWPMSVFLTPEKQPYFAGTYFPPQSRHGMADFRTILQLAADAYRERRADVEHTAKQVVTALQQLTHVPAAEAVPGRETFDLAFAQLQQSFDAVHGGFGGAPKFPHSLDLDFLLRHGHLRGESRATSMALYTLRKMARGGIYDQLGGGFHRYATDAAWLVPHFEKMLYDNALLARTYLAAYQTSGQALFRDVTCGILDYVSREMTRAEGGFCSAQDADSDGVEGKFFVWTPAEIDAVCGDEAGRLLREYFAVTAQGNFEHGASILSVPRDPEVVANQLGMSVDVLAARVATASQQLLAARGERVRPGLDDKVIAAWNGLMIRAYAHAYQVLRRPEFLAQARNAAAFVLENSQDGLFRSWRDGRVSGPGFLDDYASMIAALLDLYEACFEPRWLETARAWNARLMEEFWDEGTGGFYYSGRRHERLLARSRQHLDHATPSGSSVQAANLLRLAMLCGEERWRDLGGRVIQGLGKALGQHPTAMGEMLGSLDLYHGPACQVVVTGAAEAEALCQAVFAPFVPHKMVAGWPSQGAPADLSLLRERDAVRAAAAVHVCQGQRCLVPVTQPEGVAAALDWAMRPAAENG